MTRPDKVRIVIPCFNEADRLQSEAFSSFASTHSHVHLHFVNDGSTDDTSAVLAGLAEKIPGQMSFQSLTRNSGKAEAVRLGLLSALDASPDFLGFWDADLATPLEAVEDMLEVFDRRPCLEWVIGSRFRGLGRRIERHAPRHYMGRVFATVASNLLRIPVYDTQCGAKIFRATPQLRDILADPFLSRWYFDVELIARFLLAQPPGTNGVDLMYEATLREWVDVAGSKMTLTDMARAISDLSLLWRKYHHRLPVNGI